MDRKTPRRKSPAVKARAIKTTRAPARTPSRIRTAKKAPAAAPPMLAAMARRAVFIDVENTSSETDLLKILEHLKIDRQVQPTDLTAVGNWRSVGARVARMLASLGAHLVHSAPAVGVRDWSDLWIAVATGRWLAGAHAGDRLEIVSDDRAFDAVGDAAAAAGVVFHRLSYRTMSGGERPAAGPVASSEHSPRRRRRGGRRRRPGGALVHTPAAATVPATAVTPAPSKVPPPSAPAASTDEEAHAASHEHIRATLARLSGGTARWINLDAIANALKAEGFVRPPGSPRLVVRLRKMKDVEVTPNGMVRLRDAEVPPTDAAATVAAPAEPRAPARRHGSRGRRREAGEPAATEP